MRLIVFTKREECQIYLCLEELLQKRKIEFYLFEDLNIEEHKNILLNQDTNLVIIDYESFEERVEDLIKDIKALNPRVYVLIANGPENVELAVRFLREGAYHYLTTELDKDCICKLITEIGRPEEQRKWTIDEPVNRFVGESKSIRRIKSFLPTIAETHCNVLIVGETGTGKELLARIIHQLSPRSKGPFIILDCTTLQETIFESEVFGYEKGAFTGATGSKKGLVELADGGTLFIDEIGELPLPLQKKFLRFIQEKTFMRVGGTKFLKADVRIIAATNRDLEKEVRAGNFRSDLYFRLNTLILEIPPLRERKEDLPLLVEHFVKDKSLELGRDFKGISKGFMEALLRYNWPGNVRELINVIERTLILSPSGFLTEEVLPDNILREENPPSNKGEVREISKAINLREFERDLVLQALEKNNWNQTRAAEYLGISRKQLINKIKKYGLIKEKDNTWLKSREKEI
jgi:two-component system response regulator HydG/two-component system response regulator AtoC